jgi:O-antigen ligase
MNQLLGRRLTVTLCLCALVALCAALYHPEWFSKPDDIAMLVFLQILLAAIWSYRSRFLPVLLAAFLWGGTALPFSSAWTSARWVVLGTGALAGIIAYARDRQRHFRFFHLVALFCGLAALASVLVSAYPSIALLKALSLSLLFLYCFTGARLALQNPPVKFLAGLLWGTELVVYGTAIAYFVMGAQIFGNPNSLGAVMGVVAVPLLLWGTLVADRPTDRYRRTFAFLIALLLLLSSYARAGIAAATVSCFLLCFALRRYASLLQATIAALLLGLFVMAAVPLPDQPSNSLTSTFIYKGRREEGILGSRKSVWDRTVAVISDHPWFGSGFGTSLTRYNDVRDFGSFASAPEATREHGNSYLAITEWVGLLGGLPFFSLIILVFVNVVRSFSEARRTGNANAACVPLAAIVAAGLVHAGFEDWLFAVGYYLCIFFWPMAFILVDTLHPVELSPEACNQALARPQMRNFNVAMVGR